jgi:hypothetical protein
MQNLFVSWAGSDAHRVGQLIRTLFHQFRPDVSLAAPGQQFEVFLSSRDIEAGQEWQQRLLRAVTSADHAVVIFTQEAIKSAWLIHETAILSSRVELTIFLLGAPLEMLPEPLQRFQCAPLTRDSMEDWVRRIINDKGLAVSEARRDSFLDDVEKVIRSYERIHVTAENYRWKGFLARPISITRQNESPFDLIELVRVAQKRLVLIAQNHGFMTISDGHERFEKAIFERLADDVTIDIYAMHPSARPKGADLSLPNACSVWGGYMRVSDFATLQMAQCWSVLRRWHQRAQKEFPDSRLRIKGAYFLPITINVVDPLERHAFLTLSPRMGDEASSPRPQFIVSKQYEPAIFEFYWGSIRNGMDQSGWLDIDALPPP